MFMNDVSKQEEIRTIATQDLKSLGIKYRYKKHRQNTQENKSRKVFRTCLHLLPTQTVTLTSGQQMSIPKILHELCTFVLAKVGTEGLFRKGGAKSRQNEIRLSLDAGCSLSEEHHEVDVASVLKTFFRELPEPLIPHVYHELYLRCVLLEGNRLNAVLTACLLLPIEHLNTLAYFMQFLYRVSEFSQYNKMDSYNLAVIFGPTLLPPEEKLVQNAAYRMTKTCELFKLLIENSLHIGALSESIISQIAVDNHLSTDAENGSQTGRKKKKRRSASLTRMFSGLKKIVGAKETPQILPNAPDILLTPLQTRSGKKRKVEMGGISQKKRNDIISNLPQGTALGTPLLNTRTPVNNHPNLKKKTTPDSTSVNIPIMKNNGVKEKKSQWYSRKTQKTEDDSSSTCSRRSSIGPKLMLERRWSAVSQVAAFKRTKKRISCAAALKSPIPTEKCEPITVMSPEDVKAIKSDTFQTAKVEGDYVRISAHEYAAIESRVSAIERRISIELDAATTLNSNSALNNVQTAYEHTLETAEPLSPTADQLARRFSRELQIRRRRSQRNCSTEEEQVIAIVKGNGTEEEMAPVENKRAIRSPSARKIGSLRRKSRERNVNSGQKLVRNQSWHVAGNGDVKRGNNGNSSVPTGMPAPMPIMVAPGNRRVTRSSSLTIPNDLYLSSKSNNSSKLSEKWTSAEGFFHTTNTPNSSLETCRASIAKIRSQNAGMVLAKARLFDNLVDSDCSARSETTQQSTGNRSGSTIATNTVHMQRTARPQTIQHQQQAPMKIGAERQSYRIRALKLEERRLSRKNASPRRQRNAGLCRSPASASNRQMARLQLLKENAQNEMLVEKPQSIKYKPDTNEILLRSMSPKCTTPRNMPQIKKCLSTKTPRRIYRTPGNSADASKTPLKVLNTPLSNF